MNNGERCSFVKNKVKTNYKYVMKEVLIMELIKALPEIFEDFAEQRKKSFLTMKELKDRDVPVVGAYCTYFPQEIAMAMGAVTVGLCSTSDETIPVAEKDKGL